MPDTGYHSPSSYALAEWSNPQNVYTSNDQRAREDRNGEQVEYKDFTFGIPGGSTIDGIEVLIEGRYEDANTIDVALSWNDRTNWTVTKTASGFDYSDVTVYVGGSTDTWGRTWTVAEFANGIFYCRLTKQGQDYVWMDVDLLQVRVWYTVAAGWVGGDVNGVLNANLGSVNTVTKANIGAINGI